MDFNTLKNVLEDLNKMVKENEDLKKQMKLLEKSNLKLRHQFIDMWFKENVTYSPDETTPFRDLSSSYMNYIDLTFGKTVKIDILELKKALVQFQNLTELGFKEGINGTITNPKVNFTIKDDSLTI
jgi:hypothetical protein